MLEEHRRRGLEGYLAGVTGATRVTVDSAELLPGGAIQENWAVDLTIEAGADRKTLQVVVRTDSPSGVQVSHPRAHEFALIKAAFDAGVTVPEPLWVCEDAGVIGKPFFAMSRVHGVTAGHKIVKDGTLGGGPRALARRLGMELARIHSIRPPRRDLDFLPDLAGVPALVLVETYRKYLDHDPLPRPALEFGLRWLEINAPPRGDIVLNHNDYRTGNYMVDAAGVSAILDWEFAGWGDPLVDIGWFCAKCWRFGADDREAGGIGDKEDFFAGYEAESGTTIDRTLVPYWEVMGTMRWAVIAIQQAERHTSGREQSLELALTGHIVPELELQILDMIAEQTKEET